VVKLMPADLVAPVVEDHETSAGRPLVNGPDEICHRGSSPR
jgi:hypothetical protein